MTDAKRPGLFIDARNPARSSHYVARLDDLARVFVRMLGGITVDDLSFRDRKRLNRLIDRVITAVSRTESLTEVAGRTL